MACKSMPWWSPGMGNVVAELTFNAKGGNLPALPETATKPWYRLHSGVLEPSGSCWFSEIREVQRWTLFNLRSLDIWPKNAMPPGMPLFPEKEFSVAWSYTKWDHWRFFHLPFFWWGQFKTVLGMGHLDDTVCSVTEANRQALRKVSG